MASLQKQIERIARKIDGYADQFGKKELKVGVLNSQYENGTEIAYVAAIQEFGAPEVKIPPRPFFRPTIKEHSEEWGDALADGAAAVIAGAKTEEQILGLVGADAVGQIQKKISQITTPKLSPITVMLRGMRKNDADLKVTGKTVGEAARRVEEGETNYGADDKPLNDTGMLQQHITYVVVDK